MPDRPLAELPDHVSLSLDEVATVLFALDLVEESEIDAARATQVRRAIQLLTRKLWPELGRLLDDDDDE